MPPIPPPTPPLPLTPTGTQSLEVLALRRVIVGFLNAALTLVLVLWAASILGAGGWSVIDGLMLLAFIGILPWTVLGFWNAMIGLYVLHGARDSEAAVMPYAALESPEAPLSQRIAMVMTLRNEDPARAISRFRLIKAALDNAGHGAAFGWFLLSDTDQPAIAALEEEAVARWQAEDGTEAAITYRRRSTNTGFKAGNLRDFLMRWGADYELFLPLDADSLMDAETIVRCARIMQAQPKLGILQTLCVGLPSDSAFARIFQFGMRQGMRSYITGQAWWTGECNQFWGHNALVRIAPFRDACELPELPGKPPFGGPILSHDQVEAVLMRRAGFEVRVLPVELGSYEENPPTILEFMRRNTRWCQGNLQYVRLLGLERLLPVSRFQLLWAILMFVTIPGWTALMVLAALKPFDGEALAGFPTGSALGLYLTFLLLNQSPKLAGLADILMTRGGAARYGGAWRVVLGGALEILHSWLLAAVDSFRVTLFIVGLLLGTSIQWGGQAREAHGVPWGLALAQLWPQTLFGLVVIGLMAAHSPAFALWSLPLTFGYAMAVPFCVFSASPALGRWLRRVRLFGVPEEFETPPIIRQVQAP